VAHAEVEEPALPAAFARLAMAYQTQNITAITELFNIDDSLAPSIYASHWGCNWISFAQAIETLVEKDFANTHSGLVVLATPMWGLKQHSGNRTASGSVKVKYLAHHTVNGQDVGLLASGYWFAEFDIPSKKFISFQSLAGLEDAIPPANATEMITVSHRFILDWKYDNMTDFARLLAPGFIATEQNGSPMNRSTFLAMHNFMWSLLVDYQCAFPKATTYCDYVVDELAQTTHMKVPNNITAMASVETPHHLMTRLELATSSSSDAITSDPNGYTIWYTSAYQTHLYRMVTPETPISGLPFQMVYLAEYEDQAYTMHPGK
jgi:hypothetical protein